MFNDIISRAKSNPALIKRTGLQHLFYKPDWGVTTSPVLKLYKEMKKLFVFAMVAMSINHF